MARITLGGDLAGFISAAYDDHVKVFFPLPGRNAPTLPEPGPDGQPPKASSARRAATTRRAATMPRRSELVIDFALHDAGPATDWATQAKPGQQLAVGGPRGSFVVPDDFDWYLFIGDETALPAIGRRLEELRAGARAIVVAAVTGPEEEQTFDSRADVETVWVHRPLSRAEDPAPLLDAVRALTLPQDRRRLRLGRGRIADREAPAPPSDRRARARQGLGQGRRLLEARRRQHPRNPQRLTRCCSFPFASAQTANRRF